MQKRVLNMLFFMGFIILLASCNSDAARTTKPTKEDMFKANRNLVKQEKEEIESYIDRHGWEMNETGSGLRYSILEKGNGEQAEAGKIAVLEYTCRLISGDLLYSSTESGLKEFVIGHGGVESGLEEAVLLLHQGDKARLIVPAHLAYGLVGDDNKISGHATLIYEIKLIELK